MMWMSLQACSGYNMPRFAACGQRAVCMRCSMGTNLGWRVSGEANVAFAMECHPQAGGSRLQQVCTALTSARAWRGWRLQAVQGGDASVGPTDPLHHDEVW
jgi:hypothetical protein